MKSCLVRERVAGTDVLGMRGSGAQFAKVRHLTELRGNVRGKHRVHGYRSNG
jgi:hypothetical protein